MQWQTVAKIFTRFENIDIHEQFGEKKTDVLSFTKKVLPLKKILLINAKIIFFFKKRILNYKKKQSENAMLTFI